VYHDLSAAEACVSALTACNDYLLDGLDVFEQEVQELNRLGKVLQNNRLFVLIPEKRVRAYAAQQSEDIEPQINELLELAEKSLKILERKEAALTKKIKTLQAPKQEPSTTARNDDRKAKMLIKQRQLWEKELLGLETECRTLQQQIRD